MFVLVRGLPPESAFRSQRNVARQPEEAVSEEDIEEPADEAPQRRVENDPRVIAAFFNRNITRAG